MAKLLLGNIFIYLTFFVLTYAVSLECPLECKISPQNVPENVYVSFKGYGDFLGILRQIQ